MPPLKCQVKKEAASENDEYNSEKGVRDFLVVIVEAWASCCVGDSQRSVVCMVFLTRNDMGTVSGKVEMHCWKNSAQSVLEVVERQDSKVCKGDFRGSKCGTGIGGCEWLCKTYI